MNYSVICVFASEDARWQGKPLADALTALLRESGVAGRCLVTRGVSGSYEDGAAASQRVEVLSHNLPLKIELVLPAAEAAVLLPAVTAMVEEGIVGVGELSQVAHKVKRRLIPRSLRVRDVMTPAPQRVRPDAPLHEALTLLLEADFTGLPVVDERDRPVGILTDGDLLYRAGIPIRVRLLAELAGGELGPLRELLAAKPVSAVMSTPVVTVGEGEPLHEAVAVMLERGLRRLPVVDERGVLAGMIARVDIFHAISRHASESSRLHQPGLPGGIALGAPRRAGEAMRTDVPTASPDTPLAQVMELLGNSAVERVAVVDSQGKLLGLISDRAMLGAFAERREGLWDYLRHKMTSRQAHVSDAELAGHYRDLKASQVMEGEVPSVGEDAPLEEAVRVMTQGRLKRLPVLDAGGRLRGMLSREALLRLGSGLAAPGQGDEA
jgi:CBS domain-containing protein